MKKYFTFVACSLLMLQARSQTQQYLFNGNFNESANTGPALAEVLSCSAGPGAFGSSIINTSTGQCGVGARPVFIFNAGGGLSYPNSTVTGSYTIHMFFEFDAVNGYRRIIDFQQSTTDAGLYILNGSLNFYPTGNAGPANYFNVNTYYLITLVRNGATDQIDVYVDGSPFVTYNDAGGTYRTALPTTPILLFRDDNAFSCENSAGKIKYFSIAPSTSTAAQVAATYANICAIALPLRLLSFSANQEGSGNRLRWQSADEQNTSHFNAERSSNGKDWQSIGMLPAVGRSSMSYTFIDDRPSAGPNFYRLKMADKDGSFTYSNTVMLQNNPAGKSTLTILNNPAGNEIHVMTGGQETTGEVKLLNIQGQELWHAITTQEAVDIPVSALSNGIYFVQYRNGNASETAKVVVQH